ncbi:PKD domain-containing protein [Erythrobacter sp. GH1-10]|uniref:PKD domain-containing protein n=1 Tax=Erythrobacter sp. GH1-10 TaxID=3349334 RepID=UPI003877C771
MAYLNSNKAMLRAGVAGAALAGLLALPSAAQAATVGNAVITNVSSFNQSCVVTLAFDVTGTANDSGGNTDYYAFGVYTASGQRFNFPNLSFVGTGVTNQVTGATVNFSQGGVQEDREVRFFDPTTLSGTPAALGNPIATVAIPRSDLLAGGSGCASMVSNSAPLVNAGPDQNLSSGGVVVSLSGSVSDPDNDSLVISWSQVSGPAVTLNGATTTSPSFTAPTQTNQPQTLVFRLTGSDALTSANDDVAITIAAAPNNVPVADAGPDQTVSSGNTVQLAGTGTDADNDPLNFQWSQIGGPSVTLSNPNTANPTFTAPQTVTGPVTLTFQLVADDGIDPSQPDEVVITVQPNAPPTVNAGPDQTVAGGSQVTLAATATDPENDPITPLWTQISGPPVTFAPQNLSTDFTAPPRGPQPQVLVFQFVATDSNNNASAPDTVEITVEANQPPTAAIAGPSTASGGATVSLDGSGSTDPENDPLVYQWTQVSGPTATIANPGAASTDVVLPAATGSVQTVVFQLLVADNFDASDTEQITIQIAANNAPVANAGQDQTVPGEAVVQLDGSGSSDSDNDPITYSWTQVSGPPVTLSDPTAANPTFTAPPRRNGPQEIGFQLIVNDGTADSAADIVFVFVERNTLPVPDAGPDQGVQGNSTVTLDASGTTDADGDPITYSWTQVSGPPVTLSDAAAVQPTFTAPAATGTAQTLVFQVTVSDGITDGLQNLPFDTVEITIEANRPPVADAGPDQGPIDSGQTVRLDGTGSSDPDGDGLTYTWTQVSGTAVTLNGASTASPNFAAPVVSGNEDLVFQLIVSDGQVSSVADTVTISVRAVGTITIVQRVIGSDTSVAYTSSLAALTGTIATSNGSGQLAATNVAVGRYGMTAADLSAQGYALTDIACNDSDSRTDIASRSVALELSPNEDLVCTFSLANTREAAEVAIAEFLTGRNALILSHQPDLQRRLDRLNGVPGSGGSGSAYNLPVPGAGKLPVDFTVGQGRAQASTSLSTVTSALDGRDEKGRAFDLWGELYVSQARIGGQEGSFRIGYIGADYRLGDNLLVGALVAFDTFNDKDRLEAGEAEGDGWMAGPYLTAKLGEGFYAEARAAWGLSDNIVSPLGTFSDSFDTNRSFYSGSLIGQFDLGDRTTIRPEVTVRYIREEQEGYVDSLDVTIPSQVVDQGDISFRPRISHLVDLEGGWALRPYGEAEGILTFGEASGFAIGNFGNDRMLDLGSLRARVEGGIDLFSPGGLRASLSAFHDGIGADNFSSTGVHIGVSFGF